MDWVAANYANGGVVFDSTSVVSTTDPIIKLGNIDPSVKSVYIGWYRPYYAFNFRMELRDASGQKISEFTDTTKTSMSSSGTTTSISTLLTSSHSEWNIYHIDLTGLTWTETTSDTTNGPWTYTAPGGYEVRSDVSDGWSATGPSVLFDGKLDDSSLGGNYWEHTWLANTSESVTSAYVSLTFPQSVAIGSYTMINNNRNAHSATWAPTEWTLQGSTDNGATWTTLSSETYKLTQGESKEFSTGTIQKFNTFRWNFQQDPTTTLEIIGALSFAELILHEAIVTPLAATNVLIPPPTLKPNWWTRCPPYPSV